MDNIQKLDEDVLTSGIDHYEKPNIDQYVGQEMQPFEYDEGTLAGTRASSLEQNDRASCPDQTDSQRYLPPLALTFLILGLCLSVFIVSLDRTIIATAIPSITDQFHSYDDVGWYGSAYLITNCALLPTYGRIYEMFNIKWSFLIALAIFELGSLICGATPSSTILIVGRAIAGWGGAGIVTGSFVMIAHSAPLQKRPLYTGIVGMMYGIGAVAGPLVGGVFTDLATWRWCFYINLPVGSATVAIVFFLFHPREKTSTMRSLLQRVLALDLVSSAVLIGAAAMFFTALQSSEQNYSWSSSRVVGLLVGSGITTIIFVAWQWYRDDRALIPPRIVLQRSVAASCIGAFFLHGTMTIQVYFLPIWFQAIKGQSAVDSGVSMIAYMLANATFSLLAGAVVSKIGYFTPPTIIGCAIATIGSGVLSMLHVRSSMSVCVGYEILVSVGIGMATQQGFVAVQTVLPIDQLSIGIAAVAGFQSLGGAIFVSVGNSILQNQLFQSAGIDATVDLRAVFAAGATQFRSLISKAALPALLIVYNNALQKVFITAIPLSGLAFLAALGLQWKSVKPKTLGPESSRHLVGENAENFGGENI